jgi:serine/threonine-protein kinase
MNSQGNPSLSAPKQISDVPLLRTPVQPGHDSATVTQQAAAPPPRAPAPPAAPADEPRRIAKYVLLQELGTGGMGIVYKAWDPDLKRVVALKMIRSGYFAHPSDISRFTREREALAQVKHPNIVPIHDAGHFEGQPYFVLELLEGGTLHRRLAEFQSDRRAAAGLVEQIARAAHELHQHGMLHRDLKPSNILFDVHGVPHLSDFGLVKLMEESDEDLTKTNQRLGTPAYMAPEQTGLSKHKIGRHSDLWALGVLLFELVTQTRPFKGHEHSELFQKIATEEPPRPRKVRADIDAGLESIILKCLEKDPADRYGSAAELADELGRWRRGEALQTQPDNFWRRLKRRARRHPGRVALGAAVLAAALLMPAALYITHPDRAHDAIVRTLREGSEAHLIGARGRPAWLEPVLGKTGAASVNPEGLFTLSAWDTSLWRLCKDPQLEAYRFQARVRHERSADGGRVGIFVSHDATRVADGQAHFYFKLTYNDISDVKARLKKLPADSPFRNLPTGNAAELAPAFSYDAPAPLGATFAGSDSPYFTPAGFRGGRWRTLTIEVTPEAISAVFDDAPLRPLPLDRTATRLQQSWREQRLHDPRYVLLGDYVPTFRARAGLGLMISHGTASFCDVVVAPLPHPAKENR